MADKLLDAVPLRLSLEAGEDLEAALLREAANYLSYPLAEAVIDYCVFEDQRSSGKGLVRVLVFAARREQVDRYLSALGAAGLRPLAIDASAFALQRICRWCGPDGAGKVLLLGLGRQESSLVVLWNHEVFLQRIIPWGLEAMTAAFVASLGLSEELATKMLSRFDFAPGRNDGDRETIAQVGSLELRKLVAEIERVLLYCASEMRGEVIDEIALAGDCQAIRGLGGYLHQALGVPTRILQPFNGQESRGRLPKSMLGKEASLAVACGLALRGSSEADG